MTGSRAFSNATPLRPHILRGHGVSQEVQNVRDDVEDAFHRMEGRTSYPVVTGVVDGNAISLAAIPAAHAIKGTNLLQGQVFASLTFGSGNAAVTIQAVRPGEPGNSLAAKVVQGGGALSVSVAAGVLTVTLAAAGSTATAVAAAINASATAKVLFYATAGGTGADNVLVAAQTNLAGGVGEGLSVKVWGIEQDIVGVPTETNIPMVTKDLTGAGADDRAQLVVMSDGVTADPVGLTVVA